MEDRRKFVRLQSWLTASYLTVGGSKRLDTLTRNVSAGGAAFFTKTRLAPGTMLEITVVIPETRRTIRFTGEVRWSGPLVVGGKQVNPPRAFETGVRILRITPEDQATLLEYASSAGRMGRPPAS
jgi:hypothetical protein